jgi:hypothetical protein
MKPRIMYIERKAGGISGSARIGRVTFSKTGSSLYYAGQTFQSLKGAGFKANYFDVDSKEEYWLSGCKAAGGDRLYSGTIEIDGDVRDEYWNVIRKQPDRASQSVIRSRGKHN